MDEELFALQIYTINIIYQKNKIAKLKFINSQIKMYIYKHLF